MVVQDRSNYDLFLCCRRGDIEKVKYLTEQKEVNLNIRDQWDSTPLYYACLCGHQDLVQYLLEHGARCDASTFDGERCIYGALTNEIKKILQNFNVITSRVKRREIYQEFLRRLLEEAPFHDVTFSVHGIQVKAHRCILAARCSYFAEKFNGKWKQREQIVLNNSLVDSAAFQRVLEWIYTAQVKVDISQTQDIERLGKQCKLPQLDAELDKAYKKADSFVQSKRGLTIRTIQLESQESAQRLQMDLSALAERTLPDCFKDSWKELPMDQSSISDSFVDLIFEVESQKFYCHKAIFWNRSEYFRAVIDDHFHEGWIDGNNVRTVPLHNVTPAVFAVVVSHVYSNTQKLTVDTVYDVLVAADMFFLPGLKRQCGNFLSGFFEVENVVDLLQTARLFDLPRLEHQCTEFMAANIEKMVSSEDFRSLVQSDAKTVQNREEADTIDIIDEIRYHIKSNVQSLSEISEADTRLECLEVMLEELELEA